MTPLISCPFCGGPAKHRQRGMAACEARECAGATIRATADQWNTRAPMGRNVARDAEILTRLRNGETGRQIAAGLGISAAVVSQRAKRAGLSIHAMRNEQHAARSAQIARQLRAAKKLTHKKIAAMLGVSLSHVRNVASDLRYEQRAADNPHCEDTIARSPHNLRADMDELLPDIPPHLRYLRS